MKWNFFQRKSEIIQKPSVNESEKKPDVKNKKFEQLGLFELVKTLPWHSNGIYLEDNQK